MSFTLLAANKWFQKQHNSVTLPSTKLWLNSLKSTSIIIVEKDVCALIVVVVDTCASLTTSSQILPKQPFTKRTSRKRLAWPAQLSLLNNTINYKDLTWKWTPHKDHISPIARAIRFKGQFHKICSNHMDLHLFWPLTNHYSQAIKDQINT